MYRKEITTASSHMAKEKQTKAHTLIFTNLFWNSNAFSCCISTVIQILTHIQIIHVIHQIHYIRQVEMDHGFKIWRCLVNVESLHYLEFMQGTTRISKCFSWDGKKNLKAIENRSNRNISRKSCAFWRELWVVVLFPCPPSHSVTKKQLWHMWHKVLKEIIQLGF